MEFQKVHALYKGRIEIDGFLPGWGYDILIQRHNGQVVIRQVDQEHDWKTLSDSAFGKEWTVIKNKD